MPLIKIILFAEKGDCSMHLYRILNKDPVPKKGECLYLDGCFKIRHVLHYPDETISEYHCWIDAPSLEVAFELGAWEVGFSETADIPHILRNTVTAT